jgi:PIN domain nuclease of toxin-antitoxin system
VSVLLDTHVLLWWQAGGDRLSDAAIRALHRADAILVSPLTCWEVATLQRLGRIRLDREPLTWVRDLLAGERIATAGLSPEAAMWAGDLGPSFPGDPIDRLLYATARDHRVPLVSKDERLRAFASTERDVDIIW